MKVITIFIFTLFSLFFSQVDAEYKIYTSLEEFEKDKWSMCESATDGCNSYFLSDSKVLWWTKMFCENHTPEWSCTKYKDGIMTTMNLTESSDKTDALSTNDLNYYNSLKERVSSKDISSIEKIVNKINSFSQVRKIRIKDDLSEKVDSYINYIFMKVPQDSKMPDKINRVYQVLNMLKLELKMIK